MKNQYFGDVNDYRKYGLLRILSSIGQLRIGVCWMFTEDDRRTDGQFTQYLYEPQKWRYYDPQLFDLLHKLVLSENIRDVRSTENEQILPGAKYYDEHLADSIEYRRVYFEQMYQQLTGIDLIFFDPDNGIEIKSKPRGGKDSSKYVYWSELSEVFKAGLSILVYQHFPREKRAIFIQRIISEFRSRLGASEIHWFRTPQVVYFLATQPRHSERVGMSINQVMERWGEKNQILTG
jgi:hypothetical protein